VTCVLAAVGTALLLSMGAARGHGGEFILAKCRTDAAGRVSLVLTVDCGQHPVLKDRVAAEVAMREVLRVETPAGPVSLDSLAAAVPEFSATPDPDLPLPPDPVADALPHTLALLRYDWLPGGPELRFSVPAGNPHDVLFWLAGEARPAEGPVPWRILIAGDTSPPVPILSAPPGRSRVFRLGLAGAMGLLVGGLVWHRRARLVRASRPASD
jgi:hypothetical protein